MKVAFTSMSGNIISETIQFITEKKATIHPVASHCVPILGDFYGCELALSADDLLVNIIDMNDYRENPDCVLRVYQFPDAIDHSIWVSKIIKENNKKIYPHAELFWFVYEWARNKILPDDPDDKNWIDYSVFCSELTIKALQMAGYSGWFKGYDPNSMCPAELETLVKAIPHCKLIEEKKESIIYG